MKYETKQRNRRLNIYIIDSNILVRQMLMNMLKSLPDVDNVELGKDIDTDLIFNNIRKKEPDLLMLGVDDIESEQMELFFELRRQFPNLPVVLLTPLDDEGANVAVTGLRHGAVDFVTKPDQSKGVIFSGNHFNKRILPILQMIPLVNRNRVVERHSKFSISKRVSGDQFHSLRNKALNIEFLMFSGCMGGVKSLFQTIVQLPSNLPVPVVIVQHMPKIYTRELARQLDLITSLNVREATDGSLLLPGQIYVAPGGFHTEIKNDGTRRYLRLHRGPREHRSRPSVDVLLRSAVKVYGDKILSVFLSGAGTDGLSGASMVIENGGEVFVECRESSLVWDTPGKIADSYPESLQVRNDELGAEIMGSIITTQKWVGVRTKIKQRIILENGFNELQ